MVKNAVQKMQVHFLGWEDPLEEEMATHSGILSGKSHGQRSLAGCSPWGCGESDTAEHTVLEGRMVFSVGIEKHSLA